MCRLRDYAPGDEVEIFRIVKSALDAYGLAVDPERTDSDIRDIRASYLSCGGAFRVLERQGRVAGSYGLYPVSRLTCELRKMYIRPALKGLGLGQMLLEDALRVARELGFSEMTLETNSRLKEALGLYRKYGFLPTEPHGLSSRCDLALRRTL